MNKNKEEEKPEILIFKDLSTLPLEKEEFLDTPLGGQAKRIVNEIREHLKSNSEMPLSLFISASRGQGKTSLLRLIKKGLKDCTDKLQFIKIEITSWHLRPDSSNELPVPDIVYLHTAERINEHEGTRLNKIKKQLNDTNEAFEAAEMVLKAAGWLCLTREEAAQAAIAFSDDDKDFIKIFSEKFSVLTAWEKFSNALSKWAEKSKTPLVFIVDDFDLTPEFILPFFRAITSIRDTLRNEVSVVSIIAGEHSRVSEEISRWYTLTGKKRAIKINKDNTIEISEYKTEKEQTDPLAIKNIFWQFAGREVQISWRPTHRIRFLALPEPKFQKDNIPLDGRLVWSWYLGNLEKCHPTLADLKYLHIDIVRWLAVCETCIAIPEGIGELKDSWDVWGKLPQWKGIDQAQFKKHYEEALKENKDEYWNFGKSLIQLLPESPREAVLLTNLLISQYKQWVKRTLPLDRRLDYKNKFARRVRFLGNLAFNRWAPDPFGQLFWDYIWDLYSGLINENGGWLQQDDEKILCLNPDKKIPDYVRLEFREFIQALSDTGPKEKITKKALLDLWVKQFTLYEKSKNNIS